MEPTALFSRAGEHLPQRAPEPERAIAHRQDRRTHPTPGAVTQQIRPRLGRLAVAVGERDELLPSVGADTDHDQQAEFVLLQPDVVGRGDTPVMCGLWILAREEDSIDRSFTVLVRVICRCLPAPPHRARWPVCWPCSARALPPRHSIPSSGWLSA